MRLTTPGLLVALAAVVGAPWTSVADVAAPASFSREVKPLLARRCFPCHGPQKQEGGLRFDERDAALAELDSGVHAIVPGQPAESAAIERVSATDESMRMPPDGKPLTAEEVDVLRRWIAEGAKYEKHWAFVPPDRRDPPQVHRQAWVRNPVDAFILARLEGANLEPAAPADKRTLARRAYFDLTGLPPTGEQLAQLSRRQ